MPRRSWPAIPPVLAAALALAIGCGDDPAPTAVPAGFFGSLAPDFSVRDVNPTSPRHDENVSPRDYVGGVSAWYFGHAT